MHDGIMGDVGPLGNIMEFLILTLVLLVANLANT